MIFATMCKCKGFSELGFYSARNSEHAAARRFLEAIFGRLGLPKRPHPLTLLGGWTDFCTRPISIERHNGWSDAEPLAGGKGVRLLTQLTHLDARCRPSAEEALASAY